MWPDTPLGIDLLYVSDWCRRIPPAAVVRGKYCESEQVLDRRRRHRCRLDDQHPGPHVCWCDRPFDRRAAPLAGAPAT
ncbi:MAG TPA: hypothetical protein VIG07_20250 [Methylomirabilota bacterium]